MSSLELPSDIADKVVGMLKPRDVPRAVIVHAETCAFIRGDACTTEELRALKFSEAQIGNANLLKRKDFETKTDSDNFVYHALALGFEFRTPEDEKKGLKNTFVMSRAQASREFA
jgi:hypothetical protein